jgi:alpha-L-rhamnosidase
MVRTLLFFSLYFLLKVTIFGQNVNPELLKRSWPAQWITCPDVPLREYGVFQFRKNIVLSEVPTPFIIHLSADNRYKFYVNGKEISKGPVRSDNRNWNFETIDIAPFLSKGENVLSALVWNQGEYKGVAQHSEMTGLIVQSDILASNGQVIPNTQVNTDKSWKVKIATAYSPTSTNSMSKLQAYTVVGCGDLFDANKHDWAWMSLHGDKPKP